MDGSVLLQFTRICSWHLRYLFALPGQLTEVDCCAAPGPPSTMSLSTLSPDFVLMIADWFDVDRDINSLTRTTRGLHAILNPYVYRLNVRYHGASALAWAIHSTNMSTLRYVLDAGADINSRTPIFPGSVKPRPPPLIAAIQARSRAQSLSWRNGKRSRTCPNTTC